MTKEEFAQMLNTELERLEKEQADLRNEIEYVNALGSDDSDIRYKQRLFSQRIQLIRNLINYPAYARIQTMSDIEIEEYKRERAEEIDGKIQILKEQEEQEKKELSELLSRRKELISNFSALQGVERDEAIRMGRQLEQEIGKLETNIQLGKITTEIQKLEQEKVTLASQTSAEIKDAMTKKLQEENQQDYHKEEQKQLTEERKLMAAVSDDPAKARQMANIMTKYGELEERLSKVYFNIPYLTTDYYKNELARAGIKTGDVNEQDVERSLEAVERMEQRFNKCKEEREKTHTVENLSHLIDTQSSWGLIPLEKIDLKYLQSQMSHFTTNELINLEREFEQRKKLQRKLFKSASVKSDIRRLNEQIRRSANILYEDLYKYYTRMDVVLGITSHSYTHQFNNVANVVDFVNICSNEMAMEQERITKLKTSLQSAKKQLASQREVKETEQQKCIESAKALAGIDYDRKEMNAYGNYDSNFTDIQVASYNAYHDDVIGRVQLEAQNQADTREKELTELRQMREDALATQNQPTQEQRDSRFALSDTNDSEVVELKQMMEDDQATQSQTTQKQKEKEISDRRGWEIIQGWNKIYEMDLEETHKQEVRNRGFK